MTGLVALVVLTHLGMAAVDLPRMWGQKESRRERWTVTALLLIGLLLAVAVVRNFKPIPPFELIRAIGEPIGTPLFKMAR